jgi:hypothetical protein
LPQLCRTPQPVEKVVAELKNDYESGSRTLKSPKYGVFGARSGVEASIEGVFQQAGRLGEVRGRHPELRLLVAPHQIACHFTVTYPTKYKRLRATLSRSSLRRVHATIESNQGLARRHRIARRFFRNPPARYLSAIGGVGWCRGTRRPLLERRRVGSRRSR